MDVKTLSQALSNLIPANLNFCAGLISDFQTPLYREEQTLSTNASLWRIAEFTAGRNCLRRAVSAIYKDEFFIKRTEYGKPELPTDVLGSISHKHPFVVSLAGFTNQYSSLGIDIDKVEDWDEKTISVFVNDSDRANYKCLDIPFNHFCSLLFCAKECAFKALNHKHNYKSLSIQSLSPKFKRENSDYFEFTLDVTDSECVGRIQLLEHWVISVCWVKNCV